MKPAAIGAAGLVVYWTQNPLNFFRLFKYINKINSEKNSSGDVRYNGMICINPPMWIINEKSMNIIIRKSPILPNPHHSTTLYN